MYQITKKQKAQVLESIKRDGFMVSGWCRRKKVDVTLLYKVLRNLRGHKKQAAVRSEEIFQELINDGYLPLEEGNQVA